MAQPQYSPEGFNSGPTTSVAAYLSPAAVAPVVDGQAAVDAAMSRRAGLESALMVPNMSDPGTHAGPIGVDAGGIEQDS